MEPCETLSGVRGHATGRGWQAKENGTSSKLIQQVSSDTTFKDDVINKNVSA